MNPRSQTTPGGAFARVKDILTAKVVACFLGMSEWTIYDRCDALALKNLNLSADQMLDLDMMCQEKCGESPMRDWYIDKLDTSPRAATAETLEAAGIELARDVGEVEGEILAVRAAGSRKLSNRKVIDIQHCLAKVKRDVAGMEAIVERAGGAA